MLYVQHSYGSQCAAAERTTISIGELHCNSSLICYATRQSLTAELTHTHTRPIECQLPSKSEQQRISLLLVPHLFCLFKLKDYLERRRKEERKKMATQKRSAGRKHMSGAGHGATVAGIKVGKKIGGKFINRRYLLPTFSAHSLCLGTVFGPRPPLPSVNRSSILLLRHFFLAVRCAPPRLIKRITKFSLCDLYAILKLTDTQ